MRGYQWFALALAVFFGFILAALILAGAAERSAKYAADVYVGEVRDGRVEAVSLESLADRVTRIKQLAARCAMFYLREREVSNLHSFIDDEEIVWLALTGSYDPDDMLQYSEAKVASTIRGECYNDHFYRREYNDVRDYMLAH